MIQSKRKGSRVERLAVKALEALGCRARKQPLSGSLQDFPHDVYATINGKPYVIEVKARKGAQRTLERWRGQADLLLYKPDGAEFMVWMPLSTLGDMIGGGDE